MIDFTTAGMSVQRSIALEDDSTICFHVDDVGSSTCVLAVSNFLQVEDVIATEENKNEDYPIIDNLNIENAKNDDQNSKISSTELNTTETPKLDSAAVRGDRTWFDATGIGGSVSLFCSQCCSGLGFASLSSPETWRFFKHRLSVRVGDDSSVSSFQRWSSCTGFLVREMVRYAESKAIFTFVVHEKRNGDAASNICISGTERCLLLRLLSWETTMACSLQSFDQTSSTTEEENESSNRLKFRKVAKIVFEETVDLLGKTNNVGNGSDDIATWIWGGVDLCCPPTRLSPIFAPNTYNQNQNEQLLAIPADSRDLDGQTGAQNVVSAVHLSLPVDEYNEVKQDLEDGKNLFSDEVTLATILLQMGESRERLCLTALSLQ
jgi:HECT-like Ubiquitin-conjugating enzyme (E2)-binding